MPRLLFLSLPSPLPFLVSPLLDVYRQEKLWLTHTHGDPLLSQGHSLWSRETPLSGTTSPKVWQKCSELWYCFNGSLTCRFQLDQKCYSWRSLCMCAFPPVPHLNLLLLFFGSGFFRSSSNLPRFPSFCPLHVWKCIFQANFSRCELHHGKLDSNCSSELERFLCRNFFLVHSSEHFLRVNQLNFNSFKLSLSYD